MHPHNSVRVAPGHHLRPALSALPAPPLCARAAAARFDAVVVAHLPQAAAAVGRGAGTRQTQRVRDAKRDRGYARSNLCALLGDLVADPRTDAGPIAALCDALGREVVAVKRELAGTHGTPDLLDATLAEGAAQAAADHAQMEALARPTPGTLQAYVAKVGAHRVAIDAALLAAGAALTAALGGLC